MADKDTRAGISPVTREILDWLAALHAPHDAALARAFDAPAKNGMPSIQLGASEGKALELLLRLVGARNVVEVGTLAGYSAIRAARGLPEDGHVHTVEFDPKHAGVARANIAGAGLSRKITVYEGPGLEVLPRLVSFGPFDAVFIDADKGNYDGYGRWAAPNTRKGGLLIGDNAFFFGRLLEDSPEAAAMRRFHEEARAHYDTVCLPTPDGMLLGLRR